MAITVLSKPDAINLAANLPKIALLTTDSIRFILKQGSSTLIDDTYHPNLSNKIEIDVQDVITHQLQHIISDAAVWQQTEIVKTFTAEIPGYTITFSVILGGVSNFADTAANFLRGNFLTWQPQIKDVTYYSPEYLTYYAVQNCKIVLKAYFDDGTNRQIDIATLTSGKAYTCNMNYGYIYGLLKKYPMYYDVWVVENSANTRLSFIQRYQASQVKSKHEEWFLFQNSVGGIDTARFTGETDMTNVIESDIAQIDDISIEAEISSERQFAKNTGLLDDYERKWILDFFVSKRKWKLVSGEMRQIVISETDVVASFEEHVNDYTFTYRYADEKPLLNLARNSGSLPSGITIPVPSGSPAFLSPRLNEFPRLNLSDDILFPIQSPSNEQFAATTWGMIKGILNKLIEDQVSNIKIPDVPETLPPGPHTHPIDDVVQLKTELEKRLLKAVFDENFSVTDALVEILKDLKVNGSAEITGNVKVLGEIAGATLDGLQIATSGGVESRYLNDLLDVNITNPIIAQYLRYNGSEWVNAKISYSDLTDKPTIPNVPAWALQSSKPSYNWGEIGSKPESFPPSSHSHDYLPVNGTAADSSKLGGRAAADYWHKENLTNPFFYKGWINPNNLDVAIDKGNGVYVVSYDGATQRLITFGGGGGSCSSMEMRVDYHGNMLTRTSVDASRFTEWKNIYTERNANNSSSSWTVQHLYMNGNIYLRSSNSVLGKDDLPILKDHGNGNVTLSATGGELYLGYTNTARLRFWANGAQYGSMRSNGYWGICTGEADSLLHLSIGDVDTGFRWQSDGILLGVSNGQNIFRWTTTDFSVYKPMTVNNNATVTGNLKVLGEIAGNTLDALQIKTTPTALYAQEQQQEALLMMSAEITKLRDRISVLERKEAVNG